MAPRPGFMARTPAGCALRQRMTRSQSSSSTARPGDAELLLRRRRRRLDRRRRRRHGLGLGIGSGRVPSVGSPADGVADPIGADSGWTVDAPGLAGPVRARARLRALGCHRPGTGLEARKLGGGDARSQARSGSRAPTEANRRQLAGRTDSSQLGQGPGAGRTGAASSARGADRLCSIGSVAPPPAPTARAPASRARERRRRFAPQGQPAVVDRLERRPASPGALPRSWRWPLELADEFGASAAMGQVLLCLTRWSALARPAA